MLQIELNAVLHIQFSDTFDSNRPTEWLHIITRFVLQIQIPFSIDDVESVKDNIAALVIFPQTPIFFLTEGIFSIFSFGRSVAALVVRARSHDMRSHHSSTQSKKVSRSRKKKKTLVTRDYLYSCHTFFSAYALSNQLDCEPHQLLAIFFMSLKNSGSSCDLLRSGIKTLHSHNPSTREYYYVLKNVLEQPARHSIELR